MTGRPKARAPWSAGWAGALIVCAAQVNAGLANAATVEEATDLVTQACVDPQLRRESFSDAAERLKLIPFEPDNNADLRSVRGTISWRFWRAGEATTAPVIQSFAYGGQAWCMFSVGVGEHEIAPFAAALGEALSAKTHATALRVEPEQRARLFAYTTAAGLQLTVNGLHRGVVHVTAYTPKS